MFNSFRSASSPLRAVSLQRSPFPAFRSAALRNSRYGLAARLLPAASSTTVQKYSTTTPPVSKQTDELRSLNELFMAFGDAHVADRAEETLNEIVEKGGPVSVAAYNKLIHAWLKNDSFPRAKQVLDKMVERRVSPNVKTLHMLIQGAVSSEALSEIPKLFDLQKSLGIHPLMYKHWQQGGSHLMAGSVSSAASDVAFDLTPVIKLQPQDEPVETNESKFQQQLRLENRVLQQAVAEYRRMMECVTYLGKGAEFKPAQLILLEWFAPLTARIYQEQSDILAEKADEHSPDAKKKKKKRAYRNVSHASVFEEENAHEPFQEQPDPERARIIRNSRKLYGDMITKVGAEKLAVITIHQVLGMLLIQTNGVKYTAVTSHLGKAVEEEYVSETLKKDKVLKSSAHPTRQEISQLKKKIPEDQYVPMRTEQHVALGACLVHLLLESAKISIAPKDAHADVRGTPWAYPHRARGEESNSSLIETIGEKELPKDEMDKFIDSLEQSERESMSDFSSDIAMFDSTQLKEKDPTAVSIDEYLKGNFPANVDLEAIEAVPAFKHMHVTESRGRQAGMIVCHPHVHNFIEKGHMVREMVYASMLPMVIKPNPWVSTKTGGYLRASIPVMRTHDSKLQKNLLEQSDLRRVYRGLDLLASVPWRINNEIYDVIREAWDNGGGFAELPPRADYQYPAPPPDFVNSSDLRRQWRKTHQKVKKRNAEQHSLRAALLLKLQVAKEFLYEDKIYFPHNLDFRGRCYPIPPHLNHMGSDLSRGLLQFAEAQPLEENGLDHMKVHLANLCGYNKVSFEDRAQFADDHMDEIMDSAKNPLGGGRWWAEQEDPWQVLATCFDLARAIESGDPANYRSRLPIHKDGSCNGLQHYAALGGDVDGAASVNLIAADIPQDVYTRVLSFVTKSIEEDARNGNPLAEKLLNNVNRKTIKQTVMTSVYGVTFVGARAQIQNQLKDVDYLEEEESFVASAYIAKLTFESMKKMFTGARKIMTWLSECARITGAKGEPISWTTPLDLTVAQPYRRPGKKLVRTLMQTVVLTDQSDKLPVNVQKQRTAFPPNYVHSLDSTHMFFTAERCKKAGITFAAVHDSYWTHAKDVDILGEQLRDAFVELHSRPLLHELRDQLSRKHPDCEYPEVPERGPLEIESVRKSPYFFH